VIKDGVEKAISESIDQVDLELVDCSTQTDAI